MIESRFTTPDGVDVAVRTALPQGDPRGIVHVLHGMAEHARRYDRLAGELAAAGYVVVAHDHRGHGHTSPESLGHLADSGGWSLLVEDARGLGAAARAEHPGIPYVLLGHSMGSLVARTLVLDHSEDVDGLVLLGTAADPGALTRLGGLGLARLLTRVQGPRRPSRIMDRLTFGSFNAPFEGRTRFDWISADPDAVDDYVADPLCGFVCSNRFFVDLLTGTGEVNDRRRVAGIRPGLPVLLASGDQDPVGDRGAGVSDTAAAYRRVGLRDVTIRLYPGARHDLLAGAEHEELVAELLAWLDTHVPPTPSSPIAPVIPLRRERDDTDD
ncbi:alpha/beta hydrolase [Mobilicoccus pelagius]|uniref:Putative hydrolase n=1 Tax=Mobilicoccus pelagius NBRC 104925 TaxID=1089455 RepID=H5UR79_9MICO|nr:alpha/beta hydrolase [Mobilicoccus pelagius]GAB48237.1 putative hydrolase [Mobilicoccus pelagius NBRC 104925]